MKYTIVKTYDPHKFKFFMAYCYESDPEFIEKYVMGRPATIQEMVERAMMDLGDTSKMVMFTIFDKKELVGYFIKDRNYLSGFFIMDKYRNKEVFHKFWRIVRSKYDGSIYCGLFELNTRGISFIKRTGFKYDREIMVRDEKCFVYKLN